MTVLTMIPLDHAATTLHAIGVHVLAAQQDDGGIISLINDKLGQLLGTANLAVKLIAIFIVVMASKMGNWSFPSIAIGVLVGGLFLYGATHVGNTSDKVDQEFKSMRPVSSIGAPLRAGGPGV